jgi:YHS domain-containing protein
MIDPVCGMSVDPGSAAAAWVHAGVSYLFCSVSCLERFKEDPQGFLDMDASQRSMEGDAGESAADPEGRP